MTKRNSDPPVPEKPPHLASQPSPLSSSSSSSSSSISLPSYERGFKGNMQHNRMGLGHRPPSYGQGPSISALAAQQQMHHPPAFTPPQPKPTTLFIGSISGGITDGFLNEILNVRSTLHIRGLAVLNVVQACGPISSFKRLITPANKPQGFGFAEFQDPDGALRAMALLNNVELPALEDGCVNKKLLVSDIRLLSCSSLSHVYAFRSKQTSVPRTSSTHTARRKCGQTCVLYSHIYPHQQS